MSIETGRGEEKSMLVDQYGGGVQPEKDVWTILGDVMASVRAVENTSLAKQGRSCYFVGAVAKIPLPQA